MTWYDAISLSVLALSLFGLLGPVVVEWIRGES